MLTSLAALRALGGVAGAVECRLDRASYTEERGITVMGLFDLRLPNIKTVYRGEIAWNAGKYARQDGSVAQACTTEAAAEWPNSCWLWNGPVYVVGNQTVELIEEADMAAPNVLLFGEFGRALLMNETFATANPDLYAFDVFMLNGCADE